jgi:hypothetical protein
VFIITTLFLEWSGDLILTHNGSLALTMGWTEVRQRILRRILTNAQTILPDGTATISDYIFDINYGANARQLVGEPFSTSLLTKLQQIITDGVMQDQAVATDALPTITVTQQNVNTLIVFVAVTLQNGQQGTLAFYCR